MLKMDLITEPETMRRGAGEDRSAAEIGLFEVGRRWRGLWDLDMISWPRHAEPERETDSSTSIESEAAVCYDLFSDFQSNLVAASIVQRTMHEKGMLGLERPLLYGRSGWGFQVAVMLLSTVVHVRHVHTASG